ncbi:putative Palmitoyltransferase PFA5 [Fusarium austroafricanum]|uniref:Palmitoyltransferase n=1 Tax=Fusarium austroafricanum TaxID=2364996 RepID=A0A8H4P427_9HYPO|nr:putative Palmitoyltransferase PFA5 [Fusarium austroafricanum]
MIAGTVAHPEESGLADLTVVTNTATTTTTTNATTQDEIISPPPSVLTHPSLSIYTTSPPESFHSDSSSFWSLAWSNEMPEPSTSNRCATRWIARLLPVVMLALVAFATYDVIVYCCVEYFLQKRGMTATAVVLIVLYSILFILMVAAYIRCYVTIQFNAGFVPWTAAREATELERNERLRNGADVETLSWHPPDSNPDSPGLESFYSKDVFICERDGFPKWCSECRSWKPDRAHHSSEYGRCVYKMDHVCPWMGGIISETSTTGYVTALRRDAGQSIDARLIVGLALGGLFGLFSVTMSCTALRFAFQNITNVDLFRKNQTFRLAVRVPTGTPSTERYNTITYPLSIPGEELRAPASAHANGTAQADGAASTQASPMAVRDQQAKRTFAILQAEPGENPWHVGYLRNFRSVMGNSIIEWLLPIRHSPCTRHDSMVSDYEFGPLVEELKKRYGIVGGDPEKDAAAMTSN